MNYFKQDNYVTVFPHSCFSTLVTDWHMDALADFEAWVVSNHQDLNVTKSRLSNGTQFLWLWIYPSHPSMKFLPLFNLMVETVDGCLRFTTVTFNGHKVNELSEQSSVEEKTNFLDNFKAIKLCKGIQQPDADLQFNSETFSRIYTVDGVEEAVIRSQSCQYALSPEEEDICSNCKLLDVSQTQDWPDDDSKSFIEPMVDINEEDIKPDISKTDKNESIKRNQETIKNNIKSLLAESEDFDSSKYDYNSSTQFDDGLLSEGASEYSSDEGDIAEKKTEDKLSGRKKFKSSKPRKNPVFKKKVSAFKKLCPICLVEFKNSESYEEDQFKHSQSRYNNETVQCPSCLVSVIKVQLNEHFAKDHPELEAGCCLECLGIFSPRQKVSYHFFKSHVGRKLCPLCGKAVSYLKGHLDRVHKKQERVMCPVCGKELSSQQVLDKHLINVHSATKPRSNCKFCGQGFKRDCDLRIHYWSIHLKAKPYKCRHCNFVATQHNRVYEHCRSVHKLKGGKADVETVNHELERIREFEVQHGIGRKSVIRIKDTTKKYCFLCNEYFEKKEYLVKHELQHLDLRPFVCSVQDCQIAFNVEKNLKRHLVGVHGESEVDFPKSKIDSQGLVMLYERVRTIPSKMLKIYDQFKSNSKCVKCSAPIAFPSLAHFYDHFHSLHGHEFQSFSQVNQLQEQHTSFSKVKLICKCCGMETMSSKVLSRHVKEVHRLDALAYEHYIPPPTVEMQHPKMLTPPQYRCKHCFTYTAVKKCTVFGHIKKSHNIVNLSDNDLLLINDSKPFSGT